MNSEIYDDLAIETLLKDHFGVNVDIKKMVVREAPVSHTSTASVFMTTKNQLYVLVRGRSRLTLGDVRTIVKRMGMVAEAYVPPKHDSKYFDMIAVNKFQEVFPGRKPGGEADLRFYRLLAPYNPGLVLISEVSDSVIKQFDSTASSGWRVAAKFAYRKIKAA